MKHIIIEDTDKQLFSAKLDCFTSRTDITVNNIAYSTNTIQTVKVIEQTYSQLPDVTIEVVKTNYSALIQYT